ncbi:DUF2071 domain-containing protein [Nonomuraea sp. NPDC050310]|uniref:YqjF family protein n=1 Tax=Nonomuraea sp. NPDC050310 TaxID=3154935 RepID=UPI0033DC3905
MDIPKVLLPVMFHRWTTISFLHWPVPAERFRVPHGLEVETFDGTAWLGVTPFVTTIRPGLARFPETNVRTYVRDAQGRRGVWFLSLEAGMLSAVLGGRAGYWLPYRWAEMSARLDGDRMSYRSLRRWPGRPGARCDADVEIGSALGDKDALATFLTERYRLYTEVAGVLACADVEHRPWPLHQAKVVSLRQDLAEGLSDDPPVVHFSPGVAVRVGMWRPIRRAA